MGIAVRDWFPHSCVVCRRVVPSRPGKRPEPGRADPERTNPAVSRDKSGAEQEQSLTEKASRVSSPPGSHCHPPPTSLDPTRHRADPEPHARTASRPQTGADEPQRPMAAAFLDLEARVT